MNIEYSETNGVQIAELISEEIEIRNTQDALDIMMNCAYNGANSLIVQQANLIPDFYDLKTGIAGDILQKFSTYNTKLAIVGDFGNVRSESLQNFIYESNKMGRINFVGSVEKAKEVLGR